MKRLLNSNIWVIATIHHLYARFWGLGLKTKRQQGLIPYIFVTRSQPSGPTQSSASSRAFGGNAAGATQPSNQSISWPSQRSPRPQGRPSSSRSRLNQITPGAAVIPQPRPSTPLGHNPLPKNCGSTSATFKFSSLPVTTRSPGDCGSPQIGPHLLHPITAFNTPPPSQPRASSSLSNSTTLPPHQDQHAYPYLQFQTVEISEDQDQWYYVAPTAIKIPLPLGKDNLKHENVQPTNLDGYPQRHATEAAHGQLHTCPTSW